MRIISKSEHDTATAALAVYEKFSKPYAQRNGWTIIPADAPRPWFQGEELTTDRINAYSTAVELYGLLFNKPERFSAYVSNIPEVTTWTGEQVGIVTHRGLWNHNNFGGRWRSLRIRVDWNATYSGREYDSREFVNFRKIKS